jgi:Tol biopolymer transport system component
MVVLRIPSEENRWNLWRLNMATGQLKQLTFGKSEFSSSCTPDGKWVIYISEDNRPHHIFRVSTEGGAPAELAASVNESLAVSPDGTLVAFGRTDGQGANAKSKFIVQKLEGGALLQEMEAPSTYVHLGWTPDGRALTYARPTGNTQNVYMQPLAGGAEAQLTHFNSEPAMVGAYAWSRDGKKFAVTRVRYNSTDVVMFSNFR